MRKINILLAVVLFTSMALAQQKEKVKGSKIVTISQKEIGDFETLEIEDNLEIFLIKGDQSGLEIEADDNLHDAIEIDLKAKILRLAATKQVTGAKKFSIRITYTDNLRMVMAKNEANITALADINLGDFTFKGFDSSKFFANVNSRKFTLMANDKCKSELNLKSDETTIELSKNAQLKALISTPLMKFDMYQKSTAVVEGDVIDLKLRLDNNSNFTGKNLTAKNAEIVVEGYTTCSIQVSNKATIDATGKSEIQLYGETLRVDLRKFAENAALLKKSLK
ncbi:MAG TPA: DUF2807 domain-containing protein [Flavobacterium sp.]|nr:DUF2807 domain-containing protein [Flavobacterium sp.]HPJ11078.1 DUF2807 domain-containing protein [Flavobacterium sp.]